MRSGNRLAVIGLRKQIGKFGGEIKRARGGKAPSSVPTYAPANQRKKIKVFCQQPRVSGNLSAKLPEPQHFSRNKINKARFVFHQLLSKKWSLNSKPELFIVEKTHQDPGLKRNL
ncbi:hypothetical protein TNIN_372421 [Trichonephila inaurata madagascariensis]|uniref:Uncharacterized protein n=1 Tax=Trichonephila inaurata madagascariensis TaxID=2747483 RepID=A0A8X7C679_9ARAC|nr:hypothetical protein TNIN_372421 [Trichonephila inaurata madagascariensis]